jgi:hypothetical protein
MVAAPLRWRAVYAEADLYRAALRVYTKPLFQWRKALATSVDGRTLYDFAAHGFARLDRMHESLRREHFSFRPALALHYTFNGRHRTIYLAPWEERIVDFLLYRTLSRRLHDWLSPSAYAYRARGFGLDVCQHAVARALRNTSGPVYVVKRDIAEYFASIDHDLLLARLATVVDPRDFLFRLLEQRVRFVYVSDGEVERATVGVPFGTAVACLLANVFLRDFDRALESLPDARYFRYGDDLLVISSRADTAEAAANLMNSGLAALHLKSKASHEANLVLRPGGPTGFGFDASSEFRHLGLLFRAGGRVALAREKLRKIRNLFRFAMRRAHRRAGRAATPQAHAQILVRVAAETMERSVRNVAIIDYYLKHVDDERQLELLDRWLAEEILSAVFGGHRKGHFRRISFAELRRMGLPSLVHRRRLIHRGKIGGSFFAWQRDKAMRAVGGTVVSRGRHDVVPVFSSHPEAAASKPPVREGAAG